LDSGIEKPHHSNGCSPVTAVIAAQKKRVFSKRQRRLAHLIPQRDSGNRAAVATAFSINDQAG
jgi:hypothetical protein